MCVCCHKHRLQCLFTSDVWTQLLIKASRIRSAHPPSDAISGPLTSTCEEEEDKEEEVLITRSPCWQWHPPLHPRRSLHSWSCPVITSVNVTVDSGSRAGIKGMNQQNNQPENKKMWKIAKAHLLLLLVHVKQKCSNQPECFSSGDVCWFHFYVKRQHISMYFWRRDTVFQRFSIEKVQWGNC